MRTTVFKSLLFITVIFNSLFCKGQIRPEIGKPCPDFAIWDIKYSPLTKLTLNDLKGRWVVLDFWGEYCGACIAGLPKVNNLKRKYDEKVAFILITKIHKEKHTAMALFERIRKKNNIDIPIVYENDLYDKFGVNGLPLYMVIDPNGIVRALTDNLTEADLVAFLNGKSPNLSRNYLLGEAPSMNYDYKKPLLIDNNGSFELDFIHRTVLTNWKPSMKEYSFIVKKDRLEAFRMDLRALYKIAYFGKHHWTNDDTVHYGHFFLNPILEVSDSSVFFGDNLKGQNLYCYSTSFPIRKSNPRKSPYNISFDTVLQERMQRDLYNFFGYNARIEKRIMPFYNLIVTDPILAKRLISKSKISTVERPLGDYAGIIAKSISMDDLISYIISCSNSPTKKNGLSVLNGTGIENKIDIRIDAVYFDEWLLELNKHGLNLVINYKLMNVLVISDENINRLENWSLK